MREPEPTPREPPAFVLDHVAIGVHRIEATTGLLVGVLGGRPFEGGPGVGFRWGQWSFGNGARLELIEPAGRPGGFLHRFLARHGPGVHHVTFKVPDLARAAERARRFGYEVVGYDDSDPGWKEAFLHPKQAQGLVVQLAESNPGVGDSSWPAWQPPPAAPDPPPPVRVAALRLTARRAAAARRQWQELLQGACQERDGRLLFRWPDSSLAIAVHPDPHAPEGPLALELEADRPLVLPEGREPLLGTRLLLAPPPA
jgi:catechol 2,3-dioxygenase-like lactoylglutathione lyase family enzyme